MHTQISAHLIGGKSTAMKTEAVSARFRRKPKTENSRCMLVVDTDAIVRYRKHYVAIGRWTQSHRESFVGLSTFDDGIFGVADQISDNLHGLLAFDHNRGHGHVFAHHGN